MNATFRYRSRFRNVPLLKNNKKANDHNNFFTDADSGDLSATILLLIFRSGHFGNVGLQGTARF